MMTAPELLPCPFCGDQVEIVKAIVEGESDFIRHKNKACGLEFSNFGSGGNVGEEWNSRANNNDPFFLKLADDLDERGKFLSERSRVTDAILMQRSAKFIRNTRPQAVRAEDGRGDDIPYDKHEQQMMEVMGQRDIAEEALSQAYYLIIGRSPEWSNLFGYDSALEEISDAQETMRKTIADLQKLVYVPGLWRCAKCNCETISTIMSAETGKFAANNDPHQCPNNCGPMWKVTERDAGNRLIDRYDELHDKYRALTDKNGG